MKMKNVQTSIHKVMSVGIALTLAGCTTIQDGSPVEKQDVSKIPNAIPTTHDGKYKDAPYSINGITYTPLKTAKGYIEEGDASWYGTKFHGRQTAFGEVYDLYGMTAAHKTLPLPSYVKVTNKANSRSVVLRVNDRGPFHGDRIIDLSYAAAKKLGFADAGVADVIVEGIDIESFTASQPVNRNKALVENSTSPLFIQLAALKNYHSAQMLRRRLAESINTKALVIKGDNEPQPLYRVRIGPVQTPEHLEDLLDKLEDGGFEVPLLVYEDDS